MSLPVPLTVRLQTARGGRQVTRDVRDLSFRSVVPGGFASCTVSLDRPLTLRPDEIDYYGKLYVYDARNGRTVWEGRLEDPGRSAGADGQVWQLAAVGPSAHARDRQVPLIYIDKQVDQWTRIPSTLQEVDTNSDRTDGISGWRIQVRQGSTITSLRGANAGGVEYRPIADAGQELARVSCQYTMGVTDTSWRLRIVVIRPGVGGGPNTVTDVGWSTTGGTSADVVGTDWVGGSINRPQVLIIRSVSTATVSDDTAYEMITGLVVQSVRYTAGGTTITTGGNYLSDAIAVSEVVADLLGRLLTQYDGAGATIAATTHLIDQLAYPDGVTPERVLADMMVLESGFYWAAWESGASGRYRFEWVPWPTSVRYEADVTDGYDSTGSADGLYNAVRVRYRTETGAIATVRRTQTVAALDAAGLTREALIDLGDEVGSFAAAQRAGDQYLTDHAAAPNAGRLTIARPILDRATGRMVAPWEVRPGNLIRVRGILPRPDALNASGRDGVTVFRVVGAEFRASDAATTLDLDSYAPTVVQMLADTQRRYYGGPVAGPRRR